MKYFCEKEIDFLQLLHFRQVESIQLTTVYHSNNFRAIEVKGK